MIQMLPTRPFEEGTAVITILPTNESGALMSLSMLDSPQWQLLKMDGTVVDYDNDISSLVITFSGSQLALSGSHDSGRRRLWFSAGYDSSSGSGLTIVAECEFIIQSVVGGT